jgi:hypothetical protein
VGSSSRYLQLVNAAINRFERGIQSSYQGVLKYNPSLFYSVRVLLYEGPPPEGGQGGVRGNTERTKNYGEIGKSCREREEGRRRRKRQLMVFCENRGLSPGTALDNSRR